MVFDMSILVVFLILLCRTCFESDVFVFDVFGVLWRILDVLRCAMYFQYMTKK
jgi:hypothetical protein